MTEDPRRAAWLRQARSYFDNADPVLARLIDERPAFDPRARKKPAAAHSGGGK